MSSALRGGNVIGSHMIKFDLHVILGNNIPLSFCTICTLHFVIIDCIQKQVSVIRDLYSIGVVFFYHNYYLISVSEVKFSQTLLWNTKSMYRNCKRRQVLVKLLAHGTCKLIFQGGWRNGSV